MRSARSYTVTSWPARVSCCAAARPAGPEPTTATFLPDDTLACLGRIRSFSHDAVAMASSTRLIATGPPDSGLIDSTHAASHGAGHSFPVNSGKLFVACRRLLAADQSLPRTRSFHSGIRFPSGQPAEPE